MYNRFPFVFIILAYSILIISCGLIIPYLGNPFFLTIFFILVLLLALLFYKFVRSTRIIICFLQIMGEEINNMNMGLINKTYSSDIAKVLPEKLLKYLDTLEEVKEKWRVTRLENQLLYNMTRLIYTSTSADELLETFTAHLTSHFQANYGYLLILKGDYLVVKSVFGIQRQIMEKTSWAPGEGIIGKILDHKQPILCFDVGENPGYIRAIPSTKSMLASPLLIGNCIVGVMVLGSFEKYKFTQKHLNRLQAISGEVGLAVKNTRLSGELRDRVLELSILYEATEVINRSVDLDQVLQATVKYVAEITRARSCSLMLVDESCKELHIKAYMGLNEDTSELVKLKIGEGIAGRAVQLGVTVSVSNVLEEPQFVQFTGQKEGFKAVTAIPLVSKNVVIGVLNIDTEKPLTFECRRLVEILVSKAAVAVENALLYQQMQEMAFRDGLTGLYNYRFFRERLEEEVLRAERYKKPLSLVMLDIDNFKLYNDKYGHLTGDALLQEMAGVLLRHTRDADIVARYGGEEFVIILPETDTDDAYLLIDRLRVIIQEHKFGLDADTGNQAELVEAMSEETSKITEENTVGKTLLTQLKQKLSVLNKITCSFNHDVYHITVSAGICSYPDKAKNMEELISKADQALLKAKKKGKNSIFICSPEDENGHPLC